MAIAFVLDRSRAEEYVRPHVSSRSKRYPELDLHTIGQPARFVKSKWYDHKPNAGIPLQSFNVGVRFCHLSAIEAALHWPIWIVYHGSVFAHTYALVDCAVWISCSDSLPRRGIGGSRLHNVDSVVLFLLRRAKRRPTTNRQPTAPPCIPRNPDALPAPVAEQASD
jgi:hypothetical protein